MSNNHCRMLAACDNHWHVYRENVDVRTTLDKVAVTAWGSVRDLKRTVPARPSEVAVPTHGLSRSVWDNEAKYRLKRTKRLSELSR